MAEPARLLAYLDPAAPCLVTPLSPSVSFGGCSKTCTFSQERRICEGIGNFEDYERICGRSEWAKCRQQRQVFGIVVKTLLGMHTSHFRVPGFQSQFCFQFKLSANLYPERQQGWLSNCWVLDTLVEDLNLVPGFWFQPGLVLALVAI